MKTIRKIGFVGNSAFRLDAGVGAQVVDVLRDLGPDIVVLTRARPQFDRFVAAVCVALNIRCLTYDANGGASNIERDAQLIADCSELHAFLSLEEFEQGAESGTQWLIERGLAAGKPVYAYAESDGILVHVGSPEQESVG